MTYYLLANIWYFTLVLIWSIYISQELFVSGVGMLSLKYNVLDKDFKKINESVGTFWDGIQVWLIVALGGLFATFPIAYARILQSLYIPIYLLLLAVILRGTSIELIYKSDNFKWQKNIGKLWGISSVLLLSIEAIYLISLVIGLPIKNGLMMDSFFTIFSRTSILGSFLFLTSALSIGYAWIKIIFKNRVKTPNKKYILWISGSSVFINTLLFLSLTNEQIIFETGLFATKPILWLLPIGSILIYVLQFVFHLFEKYKLVFLTVVLGISMVLFTLFTASFPYILPSTFGDNESLLILDSASSESTLKLISFVTIIFIPIVIFYQGWKYKKFGRKF